ncbi:MAG: type I 3-dehydroquinate dehydratase [Eubacteriales bacterium]|nr:type I 3-dehydroquinate dehydratase [Eubacteriales bacterium]
MKKFGNLGEFPIVSSLRVRTVDEAIEDIKDSEKQGATGFLLHVELLSPEYRNVESIKKITSSTDKPMMILNYRTCECNDDDVLNRLKVDSVAAGASAVDIPMNTYDNDCYGSLKNCDLPFVKAHPNEVSMNKQAIEKQKKLISDIHALGGEILMSAHVCVMLKCEEALAVAKEMENRGADIAKIIVSANSMDDVCEIYKTIRVLRRELSIPVLYQSFRLYGKIVRETAWMFGSCMILCHNRYTELSNREKPLIEDVKKTKELLYREEYRI